MPTKAPSATTPSAVAPRRTDPTDFITTNCPLTWQGITVFGIVVLGFGWQSHGAPFDPRSAVGASYLIQKTEQGIDVEPCTQRVEQLDHWHQGIEPIGGSFLSSLIWTPASIRIPCASRTERDRLREQRRSPKSAKFLPRTLAGRASGTTARVTSASSLRPMGG